MRVPITVLTVLAANAAYAQDYVGDQACSNCHANMPYQGFFQGYMDSGHPWKLFRTGGEVPAGDTWPFTPVPPLPVVNDTQLEWSDVYYTIGNYFWKTRFIRPDGFIYTGLADETTQWNLATEEFVPYHAGEENKPYNCGKCHTTGYDPEGNQEELPGLIGTWTEEGIRCEACHGPASEHVGNPSIPPPGGKDCAECHFRDADFRMPWSGGFTRHHQQAEDLSHSPHSFYDCTECHNPHKSVVYKLGGTIKTCADCHEGDTGNGFYRVLGMETIRCQDCHMPFMGKSAVAFNMFTGDIRGHLFRIMTDPITREENTYEEDGSTFWVQDEDGRLFATLDYACLGCHMDFDDLTLEEAAEYAVDIHERFAANPGDMNFDGVVDFDDILVVLGNWGECDPPPPDFCAGDSNGDGVVDFNDLLFTLSLWTF